MITVWPQGTVSIWTRAHFGTVNGEPLVTGKEISAWAVQALCDGYDSHNLRMLASLDFERYPDLSEATTLFFKALSDLRASLPIGAELPIVDSEGVTFTSIHFVVPLPGDEVRVEADGVDLTTLWFQHTARMYPDELLVDPSRVDASVAPGVMTFDDPLPCCPLHVEVVREGDRVVWRRLGWGGIWPRLIAFPATLYEAEFRRARAEWLMRKLVIEKARSPLA